MDELLKKLKAYSRYLELEDSIPYWESRISELKARIRELKANRDSKEVSLKRMERPGLLLRLFGGAGDKEERLKQQFSQVDAAWEAAKWDLEELEQKLAEGKKEQLMLADSRETYIAAKEAAQLSAGEESCLLMEEISAFAPLALTLAERTLLPLQNAQLLDSGITEMKTEMLNEAVRNALQLREILDILPEGCADIGGFLENPNGFLYATAAKFGQQNRLNLAVAQVMRVVNQLRAILGE